MMPRLVKQCGCGARFFFARGIRGGRAPFDYEPDPTLGDHIMVVAERGPLALRVSALDVQTRQLAEEQGVQLYVSHFATCPDADKYRPGGARR